MARTQANTTLNNSCTHLTRTQVGRQEAEPEVGIYLPIFREQFIQLNI